MSTSWCKTIASQERRFWVIAVVDKRFRYLFC